MTICFRSLTCLLLVMLTACSLLPGLSHAGDRLIERNEVLKNGTKVAVSIDVADNKAGEFPYSKPPWWGAVSSPPRTFIRKMPVRLNGKESWVRFSAYSDLTEVRTVEIYVEEKGFEIYIDGGDAAGAYIAEIFFDNEGFLVRRTVRSGEFPEEVWEETRYSFIRRKDM